MVSTAPSSTSRKTNQSQISTSGQPIAGIAVLRNQSVIANVPSAVAKVASLYCRSTPVWMTRFSDFDPDAMLSISLSHPLSKLGLASVMRISTARSRSLPKYMANPSTKRAAHSNVIVVAITGRRIIKLNATKP